MQDIAAGIQGGTPPISWSSNAAVQLGSAPISVRMISPCRNALDIWGSNSSQRRAASSSNESVPGGRKNVRNGPAWLPWLDKLIERTWCMLFGRA